MRSVLVTLILMSAIVAFGQSADSNSELSNIQSDNVIDGQTHPEKIRDLDAYRLFFGAVAQPLNATQQEKSHQLAVVRNIRLQKADSDSVIAILADFRTRYDALIKNYNDSAAAAAVNNADVDIKSFLQERDLLVQSVKSRLQATLSPDGVRAFDSFVQKEKKHMKIAVEDIQ
jgi:hypothetical protein